MFQLSRITDRNQAGGIILRGAKTVLASGLPVGLHPSPISPHPSFKRGSPHPAAVTTTASSTVFCEGAPVLRVTSGNSCGHSIITGSTTIIVS